MWGVFARAGYFDACGCVGAWYFDPCGVCLRDAGTLTRAGRIGACGVCWCVRGVCAMRGAFVRAGTLIRAGRVGTCGACERAWSAFVCACASVWWWGEEECVA